MARLTVKVHPRAKRSAVTGRFGDAWKLDLAAPPVDGKANDECVRFFAEHLRDPLAYRVLGMNVTVGPTRRWYYMVPANGEPIGMEHRIERNQLAALPGEKIAYSSWTEQLEALRKLTAGRKRVAMQYS